MTTDDLRPIPDPTTLTTEQLYREIEHLRELVELRISGLGELTAAEVRAAKEAVSAAFAASGTAIDKAETSIEKRADATYVTLTALQATIAALMPRAEAEQRLGALNEALRSLETRVERAEASKVAVVEQRSERREVTGGVIAAAGLALAVVMLLVALAGFAVGGR